MAKQDSRSGVATAAEKPIIPVQPTADGKPKKKRVSTVDPNETPRARFLRLANRRLPNVLKRIEQLAALSSKGQYDYDERHVHAIVDALTKACQSLVQRFSGVKAAKEAPLLS